MTDESREAISSTAQQWLVDAVQASGGEIGGAGGGGDGDEQEIWLSYQTRDGRVSRLHIIAILKDGKPQLSVRRFDADQASELSESVAKWVREHHYRRGRD